MKRSKNKNAEKILETHKLKREGLFKMQSMAYNDKKHIIHT